jgi:excisionase family DNA binding protein
VFKMAHEIPADMVDDCVLTFQQARAVAGCSADTIRRAADREEIKITRLGPRRVGIRKSELRRWLDACTA